MSILANGMQMASLSVYAQFIVKGLIMLFAIGFDVMQMQRRQKVSRLRHQRIKVKDLPSA